MQWVHSHSSLVTMKREDLLRKGNENGQANINSDYTQVMGVSEAVIWLVLFKNKYIYLLPFVNKYNTGQI